MSSRAEEALIGSSRRAPGLENICLHADSCVVIWQAPVQLFMNFYGGSPNCSSCTKCVCMSAWCEKFASIGCDRRRRGSRRAEASACHGGIAAACMHTYRAILKSLSLKDCMGKLPQGV